jgi:hypothetical protein
VAAGANVKAVQQLLGHASAAMTLDVYAGALDGVRTLDRAYTRLNADQMSTARLPGPADQEVLPFENRPNTPLVRANDFRAAWGIKPHDVRITRESRGSRLATAAVGRYGQAPRW